MRGTRRFARTRKSSMVVITAMLRLFFREISTVFWELLNIFYIFLLLLDEIDERLRMFNCL